MAGVVFPLFFFMDKNALSKLYHVPDTVLRYHVSVYCAMSMGLLPPLDIGAT